MKTEIKTIETAKHLIIIYKDLEPCVIEKHSEKHKTVVPLLKEKKFEETVSYLFPGIELKETLPISTKGKFRLDKQGNVIVSGEKLPVHPIIGKKILDFHKNKLDFNPLVRFWKNLKQNISEESKDQLFQFLTANHHPVTHDGCFIAYKYVTRMSNGELRDSHTKTFKNNIGTVVRVDRTSVDPNPNKTCSHGLHVAAFNYVYNQGSGSVKVEVKVNPKDVVAVPNDYSQQKMRVCEYKVVGLVSSEIKSNYVSLNEIKQKEKTARAEERKIKKVHKPSKSEKYENNVTVSRKIVNIRNAPSSKIIEMVLKLTDKKIPVSPKSKRSVIRYAKEYLKEAGYKVQE